MDKLVSQRKTFGQVLAEGNVDPNKVAMDYLALVKNLSLLAEVYVESQGFPDDIKMRVLTVITGAKDDRKKIEPFHEAQRITQGQFYPNLRLAFCLLSLERFSPDEIEKFRKEWVPGGKRIFPPAKKTKKRN